MDIKMCIDEYIKDLHKQIDEHMEIINNHQKFINEVNNKICGLTEFKKFLDKKQKSLLEERKELVNAGDSKFMDEKDIKKINLFLEFLDKCGDNINRTHIKQSLPKLEYYIYNKRAKLWNSFNDFKEDFENWVNREGYWTNALPLKEDQEVDPQYPIMKLAK
jgi:hypothetical protein